VLEVVAAATELAEAERWWIAFGRACGWPLTNHTDGGGPSPAAIVELRRKQVERDTAASAYIRAWYSPEDIEAHRQRLGIPAEIERRCLQFFDDHFTYKRRDKIVDDVVAGVCVTRQTAMQLYARWLDLKRSPLPKKDSEPAANLAETRRHPRTLQTRAAIQEAETRCAQLFGQGKSIDEISAELNVWPTIVKRFRWHWEHVQSLGSLLPVS
jgi:hypothetical protein